MELGVLGPLQVRQDGAFVVIPGAKPRAILTMLGLHCGSVVPADTLVELLWGQDPPRTAAKALQTHISSLRRTLGDGFVLTQGAGWALAESEVDASRYKSAVRRGRDAAAVGDTSQALARFEEALALWRGIPELPDGRRGTSEKTRWLEGHAALVEDRADALLATGRAAEVIGDLEAAVGEAPLRERRWGQLMLALYRAGRQGEALGAYQRARSLLADDLGVDPGPELRRLEAAIVAQDASLDVAVAQHASSVTRAVTFLLTDIEGSTAAWEADADAMAVALARHDELVEQVVTSRGGRLIKTRGEGDATFSVFDRPSAGAAAAIELQDAITHEPWASRNPIRVRMALHTGEVELRDGDYFGRAVNRVARLRSLAEGGQILCSGATAELVIDSLADDVMLTDLGMRQLKNLARPEHVFELRLETDVGQPESQAPEAAPLERPGLPAVLVGPGPFVGRGSELDGLLSAWQTALAGGVRTVLIAGEPGVGKTRLAGEWSQRAYQLGAVVLYGRCDEDLGAPYQPFAEALRSLVPCMGPDRLRGLRGVEALLSLVPGLADVMPDLIRPAHSDPDTERYALFDAVVALLATASTSAPVLLVLDDLHWAAKPTLLLLRHLLRFGDHARVQIVGTYRSTDLDRAHPLAAMLADLHRDGTANRLSLGGLDEDDVSTYVAEAGYDDEELAHALASVTGGNPFFLIEALRHVDESGGVWDQSTLPQGVREAVSRRLSRLPGETNKALAAAAVVGSRFALELVEQVVGADLVDAFDEARQAGIVIEEPGGFYRFNHAIVRQSLLAELASVRRMRLHQRIATTLETLPGADDELLAELAHHYFECAWAGNAAKAVFYCRRAADQAMARLAYEGAADLYHRALHALEEIDDELPDRDDQAVELLVARCEALLAAGDVATAAGAVSQLQAATVDSARLAAWATCFDGQLTMLIHPERLDEVEAALGAAAAKLAELDDAAGEAKAHTVRAGCLARLGRIGDCEAALDDALTAARRAREHRRVNAVLAGAPLAALWGPNPVPRAGGRCLDVVRLLRITTDSPAVEATSTRCQAVLEAFRGRTAAARRMIDSARRTVSELGLRHALLEVEQFAGIVELIGNDPVTAETHLRKAYNGFRRMGLDADTAETAALLGRACLALDRESEAAELCAQSERLAGHALKASIAWRTLRAHLLARGNDYDAARHVAEAAVTLAERTDALVDHGDACLTLATVLGRGGDVVAARAAAEQAVELYERKGAAALADMARAVLGERTQPATPASPASPPAPVVELDTECVRVGERVMAAVHREDWDEFERLFAPNVSIENRRKIVGVPLSSDAARREMRRDLERGATRIDYVMIAARGERLALSRLITSFVDESPGAPQDELLQLYAIDDNGQVVRQVWFDVEDMDAALAELDAAYALLEAEQPPARRLKNAATRVYERLHAHFAARDWDAITELLTEDYYGDDRRSVVGAGIRSGPAVAIEDYRSAADIEVTATTSDTVATRGGRLALTRARYSRSGPEPDAFHVDFLQIVEIDTAERIAAMVAFDLDDFDAAIAELDRRYLVGEAASHARTWSAITGTFASIRKHEFPALTSDCASIDHRRAAAFARGELGAYIRACWDLDQTIRPYVEVVHRLSDMGAVCSYATHGASNEGFGAERREAAVVTVQGDMVNRCELFDGAELDAAVARFEQLGRPALQPGHTASQVAERFLARFAAHDWDALANMLAEDFSTEDRRRVVGVETRPGRDAEIASMRVVADLGGTNMTSTVVATRGARLILTRLSYADWDQAPGAFRTDVLDVIEIDSDERLLARIVFDPDDFHSAIAELDARYLADEAAPYAQTWSAVARSYNALNRHEPPLTSPDCVNVDHRHETAFGPGDVTAYINAGWDAQQDLTIYAEQVHRLSDTGAVITYAAHEFSQEGLDAEWRGIAVFAVDEGVIHRTEVFDEADIEAAITRFEELDRPTPQLENAASRVFKHVWSHFAAGDWNAMAETVADDYVGIDHRRVVGAEIQHGRDDVIRDLQAAAEVGFTISMVSAIAIRGERLVLARSRAAGRDPGAVQNDALNIVEVDADARIAKVVSYDIEDFDAAIAELDAQYLADEAAAYSQPWSIITRAISALNQREMLPTTADWVNVDHRRGPSFAPGELHALLTSWNRTHRLSSFIEAVHRLNGLGAVVATVSHETSREGLDAEWRAVSVLTIAGDLIDRSEFFDESGLDAAITRFEQLTRPVQQPENAASRANKRFQAWFAARDWASLAEGLAHNVSHDDRRRVVGMGPQHGREAMISEMRALVAIGVEKVTSDVIATRGQRVVLSRVRTFGRDRRPEAFHTDALEVIEIDADEKIVARVVFDADDVDAAFEEIDARYVAGEAAAHADSWSLLTMGDAALNRYEMPAHTEDWVNIDHRRTTGFAEGDLVAYMRAGWGLARDIKNRVLAVHRITDRGAVVTHLAHGTLRNGSAVERREVVLVTFEGNLCGRSELFDEADLGRAIAQFEQLSQPVPTLDNAASKVAERFFAYFAAHDWDAVAAILAPNVSHEDRRHVVNAGVLHGRDAQIANLRAIAEVGIANFWSTVIATRGARLALIHTRSSGPDQATKEALTEELGVVEIDSDKRMAAYVTFDANDFDAAIAELDNRYLAGEAGTHARTWSAIARSTASLNHDEPLPTTPDWANIDHRRGISIAPGEMPDWLIAARNRPSNLRVFIESVHRLNDGGAVVTHMAHETSGDGPVAEWRVINVQTVIGDLIDRLEMFDEKDFDAAVGRFETLTRPAARRPVTAASRLYEQFKACYAARDLQAIAELFADNVCTDDRRRVVNAGLRPGKAAVMDEVSALAELDIDLMTDVIATRGTRLVLSRVQISGPDQGHDGFSVVGLDIIELDAEGRAVARIVFDLDDIEAAYNELDARYVAGEAAAHADTWSAVVGVHAMFNRHEYPPEDWVTVDHRRGTPFTAGDMTSAVHTLFDLTPDFKVHIEAVHEINSRGAVITNYAHGSSPDGLGVEWRMVMLQLVDNGRPTRCEVFDETDPDAAIARLKELSRPASRLENGASRTSERFLAHFASHDWDAMAGLLAHDVCSDDRRRGINAGIRRGRDAEMTNWRATASVWSRHEVSIIAIRGERLALFNAAFASRNQSPEGFSAAALGVVEIDDDDRIAGIVVIEPDDIDAAFAELETRYLAGEAAAHGHTWSTLLRGFAAFNEHKLPSTTQDWVNLDHRQGRAFSPGDLVPYIHATWQVAPQAAIYVSAVHRLSDLGAVVTQSTHGTSPDGFDAEWLEVNLLTLDGDLINRCEVYDEADLEAALTRFDELQARAMQLKNAASQAYERICEYVSARDWDALAELTAENISVDDRRRVVNAGVISGRKANIESTRALAEVGFTLKMLGVIATRGARLALLRVRVSGHDPEAIANDALIIVEVDSDRRVAGDIIFDLEDADAAFAELDTRYLAGEAANHADTWSVVIEANAQFNRHELPATTPDPVYIDHRPLVSIDDVDLATSVGAMWDVTSDTNAYIEAVHQLSELGAVTTQVLKMRSQEGFDAELRLTYVITVEGDLLSRIEIYDESDLDAALATFAQLSQPTRRLENTASRVIELFWSYFLACKWDSMAEVLADDSLTDDRRRIVNAGLWRGRDAVVTNMRALSQAGLDVSLVVVATRGERLALYRESTRDVGKEEFGVALLTIVEINADHQITAHIAFDVEDADAAFAELENRYLAGEAAAYAQTWSAVTRSYAGVNRHEILGITTNSVFIDHRAALTSEQEDLGAYVPAVWDLMPDIGVYIEAVHRLSDTGAVITHVARGASQDGFEAEWRTINVGTVEGDLVNRIEVFDETDLDAALVRFDELTGEEQPK